MRRLDRGFERLAERGVWSDPDLVLDRVEQRLAGEPEVVVLRRGPATDRPPAARRWRGPALALGTLAVALLAAVPAVWLAVGKDPSATSVVDGEPVIGSLTAPLPVDMERVLEGASFEHNWMTAVAVGGPGLVAGGAASDGYYHDAAIWTSPDGRTWERVADDGAVFGDQASTNDFGGGLPEANQLITDLVSGPVGVVAVGAEGKPGDLDAAVWVSPDGLTWERIPHDEAVLGGAGDQTMRSVVQTVDGVVAVGASGERAAAWISTDGVTWTRARLLDQTGDGVSGEMNDVAVTDSGLVAVGGVDLDTDTGGLGSWTHRPTAVPAVWVSIDGTSWRRVLDPLAEGDGGRSPAGSLQVIAAGRAGVVVIGAGLTEQVVWTSRDGVQWRALDAKFLGESTAFHAVINDLVWDGDHLVAVGGYEPTTPRYGWAPIRVAVWISLDGGATWQLGSEADVALGEPGISDTPVPSPARLAPFGSSFVVVGNDAIPTDRDVNGYVQHARNAAAWIVTLAPEGQEEGS